MSRFNSIKPEKRVEQEVRFWCARNGIWTEVYDSKATYSEAKGRYSRSLGLPVGTPDLQGVSQEGLAVTIELKAPGKIENVSLDQYQFLLRVLDHHGFAAVIDSVERLDLLWKEWNSLRKDQDLKTASKYLLSHLPKMITHKGRKVIAPRA